MLQPAPWRSLQEKALIKFVSSAYPRTPYPTTSYLRWVSSEFWPDLILGKDSLRPCKESFALQHLPNYFSHCETQPLKRQQEAESSWWHLERLPRTQGVGHPERKSTAKTRGAYLTGGCGMGEDWRSKGGNKTSTKEGERCTVSVYKGDGHSWIPASNEPGKPNVTWTTAGPHFIQSWFSPPLLKVGCNLPLWGPSTGSSRSVPAQPVHGHHTAQQHQILGMWSSEICPQLPLFIHCKPVLTLAILCFVYLEVIFIFPGPLHHFCWTTLYTSCLPFVLMESNLVFSSPLSASNTSPLPNPLYTAERAQVLSVQIDT